MAKSPYSDKHDAKTARERRAKKTELKSEVELRNRLGALEQACWRIAYWWLHRRCVMQRLHIAKVRREVMSANLNRELRKVEKEAQLAVKKKKSQQASVVEKQKDLSEEFRRQTRDCLGAAGILTRVELLESTGVVSRQTAL